MANGAGTWWWPRDRDCMDWPRLWKGAGADGVGHLDIISHHSDLEHLHIISHHSDLGHRAPWARLEASRLRRELHRLRRRGRERRRRPGLSPGLRQSCTLNLHFDVGHVNLKSIHPLRAVLRFQHLHAADHKIITEKSEIMEEI